ncbi:MAG: DUF2946 family protein [Burkholderiaceae bacterium]|jgi:hypothetical protein|nr:DUF2946 family protein [Burkholderiaceae bacterium]
MQALRNSNFIASLVLVWFALFVGSSMAASLIHPGTLQMVCSSDGGMKMVDTREGDDDILLAKPMDCPLCASVSAPPSAQRSGQLLAPSTLAHALHPVAAAHLATVTAPPLPSRGPPSSFL